MSSPDSPRFQMDGMDLVPAVHCRDSFSAKLAKATLEEAGIPYIALGEHQELLPGFRGAAGIGEVPIAQGLTILLVRPEDEPEAKSLVGHFGEEGAEENGLEDYA